MSTIVTRSGKGSALTHTEMDANFTNLNTDKLQRDGTIAATGDLPLGTNKITGLGDPTAAQDAATKAYVDTADATKLPLAGGTMSGAVAMGANAITGVSDPSGAQDAATKAYADTKLANIVEDLSPQLGGSLDVNGQSIVSVSDGNIAITPNGTGKVVLDGLSYPTADGSANQVLKTDGGGNLSFVNASGFDGNLAGDTLTDSTQGVVIDASSVNKLKFQNTDSNPGSVLMNTFAFSSGGTMYIPAAIEFRTPADKRLFKLEARGSADDGTHNAYFYLTGASNQFLSKNEANNAYVPLELRSSQVKIYIGTSFKYILPTADGSANQVIKTDGNGNLSFTDAGSFSGNLAGNDLTDSSQDITIKPTGSTQAELKLLDTGNDSMKLQLIGVNTDAVGGQIDAVDQTGARANMSFTGKQTDFDSNGGSIRFKTNLAAETIQLMPAQGAASADTLTVSSTGLGQINVVSSTNVSFGTGTKKLSFPGGYSRADVNVPFEFASYTTTARNALGTPNNGTVIYNTSDNKLQVYANGVWVALH